MPSYHFFLLLALVARAMATHLFVTDYSGTLTTLKLENSTLTAIHTNTDCGPSASWLTIDNANKRLYCLNEAAASATANGTLVSYSINSQDGSLTKLASIPTINGPVSAVLYGPGASSSEGLTGIALAHYGGSAVSTFLLTNSSSTLALNQAFTFSLPAPGPNADRQDAPHPHETLLDPTGQYLLVPDLGADLVRVFGIDDATLKLSAKAPLKAAPGSGPRHAAFWKPEAKGNATFFYLVAELGGTVTGYEVAYLPNKGGLNFTEAQVVPTMGEAKPKRIVAPAEVTVSPDNRYLLISNRNDSYSTFPSPDGGDKTEPSDTLSTFMIHENGQLGCETLAPAWGSFPRQFSFNAAGDRVAVGLQISEWVAILKRDVDSGEVLPELEAPVAKVNGNVTCVVWGE